MESESKPAVEALEGGLYSLNIDDGKGKENTAPNSTESGSGWQSKDTVKEMKEKFHHLTERAKQEARDGDLEECLRLYKQAYKIHKSEKVAKRIEKLKQTLEELASQNSDDEDENQDGYVRVSKGFQMPEKVYNKLYPYQKEGVMWFWKLYEQRKGGILGDDMGLGKTIQVISFLSGMFSSSHIKNVLIFMPVSLLANWEREFKNWAPEIRVRNFHGSSVKMRSDNLAKIQSRNGVCLTTYGLANTCHKQFSEDRYGDTFTWDYIILDEGHKIKNTANKTTIAIRAIPAKNHFILTGTPIQNNLREMWALFDFVCQGQLLGTSRSFKQEYENPIVRARERDATAYEKRMGQEMSVHLRELIGPHFLRRTKDILEQKKKTGTSDDVSIDDVDGGSPASEPQENNGPKKPSLTRKNDFIIWLFLSQTQLQIYEDFIKLDRVKEILMTTKSPLAELNVLKKICDHPRLLSTMACKQLGLNEELDNEEEDTDEKYQWCAPPVEQLVQESGKMVFLVQLLQQLKTEGHRTLVFSQSRKMLDIIQKVLQDKGIKTIRVDGTITSIVERESRINTFQTNPSYSVFLLTTQVGGVGLTLTAADRVVICSTILFNHVANTTSFKPSPRTLETVDPSWNPATDAQAVDRAYRIGQKKNVVIYRLITCGSLEEKIYRKQVFKQAITKQTTGSSNNPFRYFTRHELRELFVLDDHRSSKTQVQLEKMHSAHRVSDTSLDAHIAFLYSTSTIFGISDHDLMFTKEAVATEEELSAASEMSDVIQAKVRRAADIMKAESSQAVGRVNIPPDEFRKKSQTKISDHAVELFIPSREDSTRFKPSKKVSKSPPPVDVVDLTVIDAAMDDDGLEQQFSAIALNDNHANSPVDEIQSAARTEGAYSKEQKERENDLVLETEERDADSLSSRQELSNFDVLENVDDVRTKETAEFPRNDEQVDSDSDDESSRSAKKIGSDESPSSDDEETGPELSRTGKLSKRVPVIDSDDDENGESEQQLQESDSVSKNDSESPRRSPTHDLFEDEESGDKSLEIQERSGSLDVLKAETPTVNERVQEEVIVTTQASPSDSENDEEIPRKRSERRIIDSDAENSDDDEHEISRNSRESKPIRNVIESDSEDEAEINKGSVTFQKRVSNFTKNETSENRQGNTQRHPSTLVICSDSENEDISANRGSSPVHQEAGVQDVVESDSENEEFRTPKSSMSSSKVPGTPSDSENEVFSPGETSEKVMETDSENEAVSEDKISEKVAETDSENEEISDNKTSGKVIETVSKNAGVFQNETYSKKFVETDSENEGSSQEETNKTDVESDSEYEDEISKDDKSEKVKKTYSGDDGISKKESHKGDSITDEVFTDEPQSPESRSNSENEGSVGENNDESGEETSGSSESHSGNSGNEQSSTKDENSDNSGESLDIQPSYTTCCPRGVHVSDSFNIRKCPCVMTATEIEAYKMHVNTARRHDKSGEARAAMRHFSAAFKLCDSDVRLRSKIKILYKLVSKSSSRGTT